MRDGEDTNHINLQAVDQGIGKTMQRQRSCAVGDGFPQFRKPVQQIKRLIEFIGEIIGSYKRTFAKIPVDRRFGIALRLAAKTDPHRL